MSCAYITAWLLPLCLCPDWLDDVWPLPVPLNTKLSITSVVCMYQIGSITTLPNDLMRAHFTHQRSYICLTCVYLDCIFALQSTTSLIILLQTKTPYWPIKLITTWGRHRQRRSCTGLLGIWDKLLRVDLGLLHLSVLLQYKMTTHTHNQVGQRGKHNSMDVKPLSTVFSLKTQHW